MSSAKSLQLIKNTARQSLASGRYHEARKLLESAKGADTDAEIWLLRGAASGLGGDPHEARRCFQKAIHLRPNWAEAHFNLGHALLGQGDLHTAANAFATAIRHQPDYAQAISAFRWTDRHRWGAQRISVEIQGGLHVVCPRSLQCATTYILLEQEDWFEPEIQFLRQLAQPGMTAVDIGANHGVYSLTLAKAVGMTGHVWAFEPASDPAACLAESIALNNLSNITLTRCALSNQEGEGTLLLDESPELNRLIESSTDSTGPVETVRLSTLDACAVEFGWRDIDFIKLDAEGAEARIIEGGHELLSTNSPLIMFEVQHGALLNLDLVGQFRALGFESYRYVPGIGALIPWDETQAGQFPQLNLFCARPDRAAALMNRGLLVSTDDLPHEPPITEGARAKLWANLLCYHDSAFAEQAIAAENTDNPSCAHYYGALDTYAIACDTQLSAAKRYSALEHAFVLVDRALRTEWRPEYAALLVRIGLALGRSNEALQILHSLVSHLRTKKTEFTLPLLPADERFDTVPVKLYASLSDWFLCSTLEAWERSRAWSSFWAGPDEFSALSWLNASGQYQTAELSRRRELLAFSRGGIINLTANAGQVSAETLRNKALWAELRQTYTGGGFANQAS